jgi:hypothetical protein
VEVSVCILLGLSADDTVAVVSWIVFEPNCKVSSGECACVVSPDVGVFPVRFGMWLPLVVTVVFRIAALVAFGGGHHTILVADVAGLVHDGRVAIQELGGRSAASDWASSFEETGWVHTTAWHVGVGIIKSTSGVVADRTAERTAGSFVSDTTSDNVGDPVVSHQIIWSRCDFVVRIGMTAGPALSAGLDQEVLVLLHVAGLGLFAAGAHLCDVTPCTTFFHETSTRRVLTRSLVERSVAFCPKVFVVFVCAGGSGDDQGELGTGPEQLTLYVTGVALEFGWIVHFAGTTVEVGVDTLKPSVTGVDGRICSASVSATIDWKVGRVDLAEMHGRVSQFPGSIKVFTDPFVVGGCREVSGSMWGTPCVCRYVAVISAVISVPGLGVPLMIPAVTCWNTMFSFVGDVLLVVDVEICVSGSVDQVIVHLSVAVQLGFQSVTPSAVHVGPVGVQQVLVIVVKTSSVINREGVAGRAIIG